MKNFIILFSFLSLLSCSSRVENLLITKNYYTGYVVNVQSEDTMVKESLGDWLTYISAFNSETGEKTVIDIDLNVIDECRECYYYEYNHSGNLFAIQIYGDFPLGLQYGMYAIFEMMGYRFLSPYKEFVPKKIDVFQFEKSLSQDKRRYFKPDMGMRGLHLHTLHPIEALYDFWLGSDAENAFRVIDWIVKIKGNFVQWVGLNDILKSERYQEWRDKTRLILDYAHKRGIKVGLNCQVFSNSSLQNAYIVRKSEDLNFLSELNFDLINLSFGEFVGNEPETFISEVQRVVDEIYTIRPDIDIAGTIHVGNYDNLWVNYNNEDMLYYFLVKYIENMIPYVHTVMYFNLIEPTVGAYMHKTFKEHKEFLLSYLRNKKRVVYHPESAYWIAFDNSVPLYLPVYLRSRYKDIALMNSECIAEECKEKSGHLIFTSGWEWAYHQTDYLSTRLSYRFDEDFRRSIIDMFLPFGETGETIGDLIYNLAELQAEFLINKRLAPYYAGVDAYVELGHKSGIIAQPDRIMVDEINGLNETRRDSFESNILNNLKLFSEKMESFYNRSYDLITEENIEFINEIIDGIRVDYFRSIFVYNIYAAVFYSDTKYLEVAEDAINNAEEVIRYRHKHLYYPVKDILLNNNENPTIYKFGYLKQADNLCLYRRDFIKARNILLNINEIIPSCIE